MAPLVLLLLVLRRVPFAALALRVPRLLVFAALRVFDAARLARVAFGRPAFVLAALLARPVLAFERRAPALARVPPAFERPALLRPAFAFVRPALTFAPRVDLRAVAALRPGLRADAVRRLRPRAAPARLRPVPSLFSAAMGGIPI
ncbi:MAG TPA: hypothetical protein VK479_12400 [Micropepsaceae bacterium]|nr:hypothetical protein [Micropepsaceae bacterium]